ncbi:hypothetical protein E2C01_079984 [Portunus trituberculatus]|uniref:Uncharacterized protein n=1 Tax=Portunus trituberculatus TaxID=210409 RepID=A0A5B7IKZ1_PORTR|nr:hypothetical protein [Portunus trituberculatus]
MLHQKLPNSTAKNTKQHKQHKHNHNHTQQLKAKTFQISPIFHLLHWSPPQPSLLSSPLWLKLEALSELPGYISKWFLKCACFNG